MLSSLTGASSSAQQDAAILAEGTSDDDAMDTDEEAQLLESDLDEFSDDDKEEKKDNGMDGHSEMHEWSDEGLSLLSSW